MSGNFPSGSVSPSIGNRRSNGDASGDHANNSLFEASIEVGRGIPASGFPFQEGDHVDQFFGHPEPNSFLQQFEVSMEIRRKIPGCGINHFDIFDKPIRAETAPVSPSFFDQGPRLSSGRRTLQQPIRTYTRVGHLLNQQAHQLLKSATTLYPGSESQQFQRRQIVHPRYGLPQNFSSLFPSGSHSSSSSSSSDSFDESPRHPGPNLTSRTPPQVHGRVGQSRGNFNRDNQQSHYSTTPPRPLESSSSSSSGQSNHQKSPVLSFSRME